MKTLTEFHPRLIHTGQAALLAGLLLSVAGCSSTSATAKTSKANSKAQLMFVQTAEDFTADPVQHTLRLVKVNPQTLDLSDRPVRIAGHVTMPAYLEEWTAAAGSDNFASDPPNATLSVYEPGQRDNTLTVIEISHPVVEGADLVYRYKLIEGVMPKAGGATALFVDWIGAGGGVGRGFHGVGAGGRGVGVR